MSSDKQVTDRLRRGIVALFKAYKEPMDDPDMIAIWMRGLAPFGEHGCAAVEEAVYADEAFMPRVGQVRARAERRSGLLADAEALWPETITAMRAWISDFGRYECCGGERPPLPFLPPAAAYAVQVVGDQRFDIPRDSDPRLPWLRKEFAAAVASFNEKPVEDRLRLIEDNDQRLLERGREPEEEWVGREEEWLARTEQARRRMLDEYKRESEPPLELDD